MTRMKSVDLVYIQSNDLIKVLLMKTIISTILIYFRKSLNNTEDYFDHYELLFWLLDIET